MRRQGLVLVLGWGLAAAAGAADMALNCGGPAVVASGVTYAADRPYSAATGSGYVGGAAATFSPQVEIGGTEDLALYHSWREGATFGYRFDVAPGRYVVTLHFCEDEVNLVGHREIAVAIEGALVLQGMDPVAVAGRQYAIVHRFLATVQDGALDVLLTGARGDALLSAIRVAPAVDDGTAPAAPAGLAAHAGYGQTIVRWGAGGEADLAGYRVWRSAGLGTPVLLTPAPTPLHRFLDGSAVPGTAAIYRVAAVDLFGREGAAATVAAPAPLVPGTSPLPTCDLSLAPAELRFLFKDPLRDLLARGTYGCGGVLHESGIRHRGRATRSFAKPSLKVVDKRDDVDPAARERANLKAEPASGSLLEERLAAELFRAAGVPAPDMRPLHLRLNGEYLGLYHAADQVDGRWLAAHGYAAGTALWKAQAYQMDPPGSFSSFLGGMRREEGGAADQERLFSVLDELTAVNEGDFDAWLDERWERDEVISFLAVAAVTANSFDGGSFYVARDGATDRLSLIPWDLNNRAFGQGSPRVPPYVDDPVLRNSMQAFGLEYDRWNRLFTRVLMAPEARRLLAARIEQVLASPWLAGRIDAAHAEVRADAIADVRKMGWEDPTWFLEGPARLKSFLAGRGAFLAAELPKVREPLGDLALSEVMVMNAGSITDERGEPEPWIEIWNRSGAAQPVGGLYLTNDVDDRTRWPIPAGTLIPAGGRLCVWADGEPGDGPLHTTFRLDPHRGCVALSSPVTRKTLDAAFYGAQIPGVAYGRLGSDPDRFAFLDAPTPGAPNGAAPHALRPIERVAHRPLYPGPADPVTITARIHVPGLSAATLHVRDGAVESVLPMADDGQHGDGAAGDGTFGAILGPRPARAHVAYHVEALYQTPRSVLLSPADAPAGQHAYEVHGLTPPRLFVNEIVAANDQGAVDEDGEHDDWIEIWNGESFAVDLGGMFLSDNRSDPSKWQFRAGTRLDPGQGLVVWLDGELDGGPLHASFRLKSRGDQVILSHRYEEGAIVVDAVDVPALPPDASWARCPDGGAFRLDRTPTPGRRNGPCL